MPTVDDTEVCPICGEEYWIEFDCNTGVVTKLSMCACDRLLQNAVDFLKKKGLYDEFMRFHKDREKERLMEEQEQHDVSDQDIDEAIEETIKEIIG